MRHGSNAEGISKYVAKYIGKDAEFRPLGKGVRRVRYSRGWKVAGVKFAWLSPGWRLWRAKVKACAEACGFTSLDDFAEAFGRRWAFMLHDAIMATRVPCYPDLETCLLDERRKEERAMAAYLAALPRVGPQEAARLAFYPNT